MKFMFVVKAFLDVEGFRIMRIVLVVSKKHGKITIFLKRLQIVTAGLNTT